METDEQIARELHKRCLNLHIRVTEWGELGKDDQDLFLEDAGVILKIVEAQCQKRIEGIFEEIEEELIHKPSGRFLATVDGQKWQSIKSKALKEGVI